MNWKNKRVLVTGGTGFVGSHLIESLVKKGASVVSTFQVIRPNSYFDEKKLLSKVTLSQTDVTNFEKLFDLVTKLEIEYIFHLAAQPIVETAYYNPRRTLNTNIMGTVNVLEAARLYPKIKAVVVASSDKAYGKSKGEKYLETDPLRGTHPYEVSKSATDLIATTYAKTYGLPVVTTRFGNIYGEGDQNYSRIIPGIMNSIISKTTLELRSDGSFVRDYLHVKDVVSGYLLIAENIAICKGEAFNFGSNDTHSVLDLLAIAEKSLSRKISYTIQNTAKNEIPYQSLDFSKAKKQLLWTPKMTLKKSLHEIFEYYKNIL